MRGFSPQNESYNEWTTTPTTASIKKNIAVVFIWVCVVLRFFQFLKLKLRSILNGAKLTLLVLALAVALISLMISLINVIIILLFGSRGFWSTAIFVARLTSISVAWIAYLFYFYATLTTIN